jgi:gliding-associated putative ABC transporter substrate-binding component GldG
MNKQQNLIITLLSVAAMVLVLLISRQLWFRLDLTDNKAYTISEASRNLYTEIPDQVQITYYVSDKLAAIHPLPGEIEDLIREYANSSHGRIRVTVRDPVKAGLEQVIEQLGVQPQQIETVEKDQASVATVYTGIVIEYLDWVEVLPVVFSLNSLEYDLTSRIRTMIRGTEREVGVIVGNAASQWYTDFSYLAQAFYDAGFLVREIVPGDEISDTLPVLFVLGGVENLDEWALYRIDRYIQGGGKVLFALDGVAVDTSQGIASRVMTDGGLISMVSYYGATVQPELVLDRSALTLQYQSAGPTGSLQYRIVRYPHWVAVLEQNGNPDHPITASFSGIDLFWPSPIELNPSEPVEAVPLFYSSAEAWLQTRQFTVDPDHSILFETEAEETRGTRILAAALTGKFPSWFKGVPKPERPGSGETLPDLPAETRESRIIVIGDTEMASNYVQYNRSQRNLDFLVQAADWLGNDDDIVGIRNRLGQTGRLDKIVDGDKRSGAIRFAQILNVVIIPLGVICLGIFITGKRRSMIKGKGRANDGL